MSHRDEQAEKAVIGAVLCGATRALVEGVRADDFTETRRHIWEAIEGLFSQGKAVDHLTLADALLVRGRLAEVGGPAELMRMDSGGRLAQTALPQHIGIIQDRARRRRIATMAKRMEAMSYDLNLDPARIAAEASQAALDVGRVSDDDESGDVDLWEINDRWSAWSTMTEEERRRHEPYLPMPWEWMREAGFYGFPQSLSIVAGRSGIGKTAMLSSCMAYWLRVMPHRGAVIGLEDGTAWLDERWLAKSLRMDYAAVGASRLTQAQEMAYADHMEHIGPLLRSKLRKYRRAGMDAGQLITRCRRWIDEGVKWIVVDHGLRVKYDVGSRRDDKVIGDTMDTLANLALNTKTHIVVAWHLNRASDDDSMPTQGDIKESGYVDAAARAIFGLWKKDNRTMVTVVKATKVAPVGMTCELAWEGRTGMFDTESGRVVDFQAEAQAAKEAAKKAKTSGVGKFF